MGAQKTARKAYLDGKGNAENTVFCCLVCVKNGTKENLSRKLDSETHGTVFLANTRKTSGKLGVGLGVGVGLRREVIYKYIIYIYIYIYINIIKFLKNYIINPNFKIVIS